jgi:hypothetical protein
MSELTRYVRRMGVAVVWAELTNDDADVLLRGAGYVLAPEFHVWSHPELKRELDADIAALLTLDQLVEWIAAGRSTRVRRRA